MPLLSDVPKIQWKLLKRNGITAVKAVSPVCSRLYPVKDCRTCDECMHTRMSGALLSPHYPFPEKRLMNTIPFFLCGKRMDEFLTPAQANLESHFVRLRAMGSQMCAGF